MQGKNNLWIEQNLGIIEEFRHKNSKENSIQDNEE